LNTRLEEDEDMFLCFNEKELASLFEKWASEAEEYRVKKAKFEEYKKRVKEAAIPFIKKQDELLEQKRKRDKKAMLTAEDRDKIWRSFPKIHRKIIDEVFGK
jgi:hypothetical protein